MTNETTTYLSYLDSLTKLYNSKKSEILNNSILNRQKQQTKAFLYDVIEPNLLNIHAVDNADFEIK